MITASTAPAALAVPTLTRPATGPPHWQGGGGPACFLLGLLVLGLLALAAFWFYRRRSDDRGGPRGRGGAGTSEASGRRGAEDILAEPVRQGRHFR